MTEATNEMTNAEISQELTKGLRMFKAFEHADAIIAGVQRAQQMTREAEDKRDQAQVEAAEATSKLEAVNAELETAESQYEEAKDRIELAVTEATERAAAEVQEACDKANAEKEKIGVELDGQRQALVTVKEAVRAEEEKLAQARAHLQALREQLPA